MCPFTRKYFAGTSQLGQVVGTSNDIILSCQLPCVKEFWLNFRYNLLVSTLFRPIIGQVSLTAEQWRISDCRTIFVRISSLLSAVFVANIPIRRIIIPNKLVRIVNQSVILGTEILNVILLRPSTIKPLFTAKPHASSISLNRSNSSRSSPRFLSCSANNQIVFSSGTGAARWVSPKKRGRRCCRECTSPFSGRQGCRWI